MIKPGEVQKKAREAGVRDQQIEKDYILSWILRGLGQHAELSSAVVFKGGTLLKKVYFTDYRFSEDLDFTLLGKDMQTSRILKWFAAVFEYIKTEANIPLEIIDHKEHKDGGINFYISYIGPLGGIGANKKIKVDISKTEVLLFNPITQNVPPIYSDLEPHKLLCYALEEVLIEKMRSVMQRMQARDFYDIWYLLEVNGMDLNLYVHEFQAKCKSKQIDSANFQTKLNQRLAQYEGRWKASLSDQIHDLPNFDEVKRQLLRHIKNFNPS